MTLEFSGTDAGVVVSMTAKKINILNCDQRYSIRPVGSGSATGALAQSPTHPPPPPFHREQQRSAVVQEVCLRTIVMQMRLVAIQSLLNFGVMTVYSGHTKGNICN